METCNAEIEPKASCMPGNRYSKPDPNSSFFIVTAQYSIKVLETAPSYWPSVSGIVHFVIESHHAVLTLYV